MHTIGRGRYAKETYPQSNPTAGGVPLLGVVAPITYTAGVIGITPADGTHDGSVTQVAQSFAGNKTFLGNVACEGTLAIDSGQSTFGPAASTQAPAAVLITNDVLVHTLLTIPIPLDACAQIDAVLSVKQPGTANAASYSLSIGYARNGGAGPIASGTLSNISRGSNAGAPPAGWIDPVFTIAGNSILIQVQGPAGPITQRWNGVAQVVATS